MEKIIELPKIYDRRGNLSFIESMKHVPFKIERAYWIYDVPGGEVRGSHAFRTQQEFIIAISGSFDVVLNDGENIRRHHLNRSYKGVYVPPMTWRTLDNFSTNSLCLVLSSSKYDPSDYIEDFESFQAEKINSVPFVQISESVLSDSYNKNKPVFNDIITPEFLKSTVFDCKEVILPQVSHNEGNLTALNNNEEIPYEIKRAFYLYDVPAGAERGGHAHKFLYQFIIAASGSLEVELDDGTEKLIVRLDRPNRALLIVPGIWGEVKNFSGGAISLVFVSELFIEEDYIRDYKDFNHIKTGIF